MKTIVENGGNTTYLFPICGSFIVSMNGTTDYLEIFGYGDGGGTTQTSDGGAAIGSSTFQASWLRS